MKNKSFAVEIEINVSISVLLAEKYILSASLVYLKVLFQVPINSLHQATGGGGGGGLIICSRG